MKSSELQETSLLPADCAFRTYGSSKAPAVEVEQHFFGKTAKKISEKSNSDGEDVSDKDLNQFEPSPCRYVVAILICLSSAFNCFIQYSFVSIWYVELAGISSGDISSNSPPTMQIDSPICCFNSEFRHFLLASQFSLQENRNRSIRRRCAGSQYARACFRSLLHPWIDICDSTVCAIWPELLHYVGSILQHARLFFPIFQLPHAIPSYGLLGYSNRPHVCCIWVAIGR
jgi:hypothetical protein